MKNATFSALTTLQAASAQPHLMVAGAASNWTETQPECWRSEAFAEDLADMLPATSGVQLGGPGPKRPLLRRAIAAVLGR